MTTGTRVSGIQCVLYGAFSYLGCMPGVYFVSNCLRNYMLQGPRDSE